MSNLITALSFLKTRRTNRAKLSSSMMTPTLMMTSIAAAARVAAIIEEFEGNDAEGDVLLFQILNARKHTRTCRLIQTCQSLDRKKYSIYFASSVTSPAKPTLVITRSYEEERHKSLMYRQGKGQGKLRKEQHNVWKI